MPIHNWSLVDAGIFHHFHHSCIEEISRVLNGGLLPKEYYALSEQIAGGLGPDVLTLQKPETQATFVDEPESGATLTAAPPRVRFRALGLTGFQCSQGQDRRDPPPQQPSNYRNAGDCLSR